MTGRELLWYFIGMFMGAISMFEFMKWMIKTYGY